ncbi:hypothetical protein N9977_00410 [bacterium]|nr:hypothetical protein [bacterium]MDB4313386.1 hypothetical protein [bacterium]
MQSNKRTPRGAVQLSVIGLLVVAFISAIIMGSLIAQGDFLTAYLGLLVVLGVVALQQLKSTFWLAIPFAMVSQLPAISIIVASLTLGELWILASIVFVSVYWVLERRKLSLFFSGPGIWMYAYLAIAVIVLVQNPVGLGFTGASMGGLRHYIKIILGFVAFFIIANSTMGEKNAQRIVVLLIIGVGTETVFKLSGAFIPQIAYLTASAAGGGGESGFYGWSQLMAVFPSVAMPFIFARYTISDILNPKRWWVVLVVLILVGMALISGKRSLAMLVLIYPCLLAFIRGNVLVAASFAMAGCIGLAGLYGVHASGMALPKTTQRVLSVLPGVEGLDREVASSADNTFRETLNRFALRDIRERPLLGEGFTVNQEMLFYLETNPDKVLESRDHAQGAQYAATSNWHNTWLGIAADFGIPAAIVYALLVISFIMFARKLLKRLDPKGYQWTLVAALLAIMIGELLRSWQFGHASLTYWGVSWRVGVLFAVQNWLRQDAAEKAAQQNEQVGSSVQQMSNQSFAKSRL